jgi:signal transduction histidine kinase
MVLGLGAIADLPWAQERVLTVESTLPEAWIKGDTDKLKQVFINLVRNACEAVEANDILTWCIDRAEQPHHVCVSVHNGGPPIPTEVLAKLGQPFFTTKSGGNGLGIESSSGLWRPTRGTSPSSPQQNRARQSGFVCRWLKKADGI